jgi:hypothetical protein
MFVIHYQAPILTQSHSRLRVGTDDPFPAERSA